MAVFEVDAVTVVRFLDSILNIRVTIFDAVLFMKFFRRWRRRRNTKVIPIVGFVLVTEFRRSLKATFPREQYRPSDVPTEAMASNFRC